MNDKTNLFNIIVRLKHIIFACQTRFIRFISHYIGCLPFKIDQHKVIFDNFEGCGYGDDPKYIAEELRKKCSDIKLVWVVSDMSLQFPKEIKKVKYGTIQAAYQWATSKVWVDNCKSSIKVKKKNEQYYIQTWHSMLGLKRNEKDAEKKLSRGYRKYSKQDAARTDLMYSNNDFRVDKYSNSYWYTGKVIKCDVPRMGIMINPSDAIKEKVYNTFKIDKSKKIVLYAPTFRKKANFNLYVFNYNICIKALEKRFKNNFVMLFRLHPNDVKLITKQSKYNKSEIINASTYPDMQELLMCSDVLITDYSACMFDFGFAKKPVFLFVRDLEKYRLDRNLYFSLDELPFQVVTSVEELVDSINEFDEKAYINKLETFKDKVGFEETGNGASYIANIITSKLKVKFE